MRRLAPLLALLLVAGCGQLVVTPEPVYLRAAGSTTLGPLLVKLAGAFARQAPGTDLDVTAAGTQYGLEALRRGDAELALASWLPSGSTQMELEAGRQATRIARDGIAVIVHPSNPVRGLGLLQLRDLFGGRAYEWRAVGQTGGAETVQPVSREDGSGTRAAFEALAMEGQPPSPRAVIATSSEEVVDYVASHREAIGYVSAAYVTDRVRMVAVEGELPTAEAVRRGSYVLSRDLWLVTADPTPPVVSELVDFILSAAGQKIVAEQHVAVR